MSPCALSIYKTLPFSDTWVSIQYDTCIPIAYGLSFLRRPLKPSCLLTLNGSQLGGFLIFPEMSNFNSHPGIAGGLPKGN
jgi:hypothetical protein